MVGQECKQVLGEESVSSNCRQGLKEGPGCENGEGINLRFFGRGMRWPCKALNAVVLSLDRWEKGNAMKWGVGAEGKPQCRTSGQCRQVGMWAGSSAFQVGLVMRT